MDTQSAKRPLTGDKTIFIVEDNGIYAKSLQAFIQSHFHNITEAKIFNIGEMSLMEMHHKPIVIIMDYYLNSKYAEAHNGLEIIEVIKTHHPETNIIVLSSQTDSNIILEAINKFDCFYVHKDQEAFNKIELYINQIINNDSTPPGPWN